MNFSRGLRYLLDRLKFYARRKGWAFPSQKVLAIDLKCSVQTILRWISQLKKFGAITVQKCGPRSAKYFLCKDFKIPTNERSFERSFERSRPAYPISEVNLKENPKEETQRMPPRSESIVNRQDHGKFEEYIGVFLSHAKPLNEGDVMAARVLWGTLDPANQMAAFRDIQETARAASEARYIPRPANHLRNRPWTRRLAPGVVAMTAEEKHRAEVLAILRSRRLA